MTPAAVARSLCSYRRRWPVSRTPWHANRQRHSRATVLLAVATLALAQTGLSVAVETVRPQWRDPDFFHRRARFVEMNRWAATTAPGRPTVVVLGGSRPLMGFRPRHLGFDDGPTDPIIYNCSRTGGRPFDLLMYFNRLCEVRAVPDYLVIDVLPPNLVDPHPIEEQVRYSRLSKAELALLQRYASNPLPGIVRWCGTRLGAGHTYRFDLLAHAGLGDLIPDTVREDFLWKAMQPTGESPFYPAEWTDARRERATKFARETYEKLISDFRINPEVDRIYRDLLSSCRERGVRAALLVMPESPVFRSFYPPGGRETFRAHLAGLSCEFGVPFFDASEWFDDEVAFTDGHHLLGPASEAFSKRLGRECLGPWLRGG